MAWRDDEEQRRLGIWQSVLAAGGPTRLPTSLLNAERVYRGAQGVWVDKQTTRGADAPEGAAVGVLHTGRHYPDDLTTAQALYHYPKTLRAGRRDANEIEALRAAFELRLPIFFVTHTTGADHLRDVYLGYVAGVNDEAGQVLILFQEAPPAAPVEPPPPEEPFAPFDSRSRRRTVTQSARDPEFKYKVVRLFGPSCGMCGVSEPRLLDAAHIIEKENNGTDDPRNGVVLCALHHRAFDADLVAIEPGTLTLRLRSGYDPGDLRITTGTLTPKHNRPHDEALRWRWDRWHAKYGEVAAAQ